MVCPWLTIEWRGHSLLTSEHFNQGDWRVTTKNSNKNVGTQMSNSF